MPRPAPEQQPKPIPGVDDRKKTTHHARGGPQVIIDADLAQALKLQAPAAPPSKELALHTSKAAIALAPKLAPRLGQISTRMKSGESLGSLGGLAQDWNEADMGEVTSGLTRDRELIIDPSGPSSQSDKMLRLKKSMREFDNAWYDADKAYTVKTF
jgi:hypothetical protein